MWILGNLLSDNPTILFTVEDNKNKKEKTRKKRITKKDIEYKNDLKKFLRGTL